MNYLFTFKVTLIFTQFETVFGDNVKQLWQYSSIWVWLEQIEQALEKRTETSKESGIFLFLWKLSGSKSFFLKLILLLKFNWFFIYLLAYLLLSTKAVLKENRHNKQSLNFPL